MSTKYCRGCSQERDIEDFNWKNRTASLHQSKCRFCTAENSRVHYEKNRQMYLDRAHNRNERVYEENIRLLHEYLSAHPCVDCGCNDIRVLEFDHIRGKKKGAVSRMVIDSYSWTTILAEITKCEVRCANCHRIKTGELGGFWRDIECSNRPQNIKS